MTLNLAALCEIVAVFAFLCFFVTFCFDFAHFKVQFEVLYHQESDTQLQEQESLIV
jgi:hypothetical protein